MKALQKHQALPGARLIDAPIPEVKRGEVLVKVKATSICGTDVHIYDWDHWAAGRVKPPLIFGHECCGEIVELGEGVTHLNKGDLISAETHISCRTCFQCKTGNEHICENVKILGIDTQGVFAEYAALPAHNCWVNEPSLPPQVATAQEPLGNAVHMVFECKIPNSVVTIFGCGPIGLCAISLCKYAGAKKVIAVDVNPYKLDLAHKMGADVCIDATKEKVVRRIKDETLGRGADVFLEVSGSEKAINEGFASLRAGGEASMLGIPSKPVTLDIADAIVFKSARVYGINGRHMFDTWFKVRDFLKVGAVDLNKIITHKFKMSEFEEAFEIMKSGKSGKIVLMP